MTGFGAVRDINDGIRSHDGLISMVREMIDDPRNCFMDHRHAGLLPGGPPERRDYGPPAGKNSSLVLAEDTAVELGAPSMRSVSLFLWSAEENAVPAGIWTAGPELSLIRGRSVSYAQIVMARVRPGADPIDGSLRGLMNLTNRVAGLMTRSLQGRIWIRIHDRLLAGGFSLADIGERILSIYCDEAGGLISRIGVVIVADDENLVAQAAKIQATARVINGENAKLRMEEDGSMSCEDLDCSSCGEKRFCDTLRDVISARREKQ